MLRMGFNNISILLLTGYRKPLLTVHASSSGARPSTRATARTGSRPSRQPRLETSVLFLLLWSSATGGTFSALQATTRDLSGAEALLQLSTGATLAQARQPLCGGSSGTSPSTSRIQTPSGGMATRGRRSFSSTSSQARSGLSTC